MLEIVSMLAGSDSADAKVLQTSCYGEDLRGSPTTIEAAD